MYGIHAGSMTDFLEDSTEALELLKARKSDIEVVQWVHVHAWLRTRSVLEAKLSSQLKSSSKAF